MRSYCYPIVAVLLLSAGIASGGTLLQSECSGIDEFEVCKGTAAIGYSDGNESLQATVDLKREADRSQIRPQLRYSLALPGQATLATGVTTVANSDAPDAAATVFDARFDVQKPLPAIESLRWQIRENQAGVASEARIAIAAPVDAVDRLQAEMKSTPDGVATYAAQVGLRDLSLPAGWTSAPAIRSLATVRRSVQQDAEGPVRIGVMTELRGPGSAADAASWSPFANYLVRVRYEEGEASSHPSLEYRRAWNVADAGEVAFDLFLRDETVAEGSAAKLSWNLRF